MESISHLLQNGRRCMRMQISIKCECFTVANILSFKTCNPTSSLCCPSALPLSLLLSIFIHVISFVSGPMLPALCLKRLKEEAPFILSTLSNYYWTQVRKLWSLDIGYQSTRLSLQWCCCAHHRFLSHSREWKKLNACFGSSVKSRWVLLSWRSLIQLLQMKYPPPLLHHPLRSSRRVSGLAWWVSWRRQVLAAYLKWSLPSISVSLMLKDASPAEILDQARSTLYSQQRSSWMAARVSLSMRPSMVEALWKPDLQGIRAEGYSQYYRIPLRIWPSTLQVCYYHAPRMTAFLMLLYAIYCLMTAPVSTLPKDTAIHSPRPSMLPLPWSNIASIWYSGSSQAPWGTARSAPMQWPSAPESPHLSVHVPTSASSCSLDTPSPRICTLCGLHTTTFSAGLSIGCFAVDACRVGIPSTTFIAKGLLPWLQPYTVLGWCLFHWWT